jgi:hypothetical protein
LTLLVPNVPESKQELLDQLIGQLAPIHGMAAIVLGGSYASGTQHAQSDLDLGLYYYESNPFDLAEISRIAHYFSVNSIPTVTGFYAWGAWVNGGAWIHTQAGKVDFLYRNLDQIQRTIDDTQQGITQHDYDQQPTHGFYSVIYLAETKICLPLFDPQGVIANLKQQVEVYPPRLKQNVIADSLWGAEFTLLHARDFAAQGDVYNTVGCLTRAVADLNQALFALNERYFIRYKRVMAVIDAFPLAPPRYVAEVSRILASPGYTVSKLTQSVRDLHAVWKSVVELAGGQYQPKFTL